MIIGLGIDIVSIDRFIKTKHKKRILKRLLNASEKINKKDIYTFLSKNFAIKESLVKALGVGFINGLSFKNICIKKNILGKPFLPIRNNDTYKILLSLSYENHSVIAMSFILILCKFD